MKTAELEGRLLDYWVAKSGVNFVIRLPGVPGELRVWMLEEYEGDRPAIFAPSTKWQHGGPIIEHAAITLLCDGTDAGKWRATDAAQNSQYGETALIAAMRCKVAGVYGNEVPDDLK